jgi:hypothetical protein
VVAVSASVLGTESAGALDADGSVVGVLACVVAVVLADEPVEGESLEHATPISDAATAPASQRHVFFELTIDSPKQSFVPDLLCHNPPDDHLPNPTLCDEVTRR